jgi:hypothetical protein
MKKMVMKPTAAISFKPIVVPIFIRPRSVILHPQAFAAPAGGAASSPAGGGGLDLREARRRRERRAAAAALG